MTSHKGKKKRIDPSSTRIKAVAERQHAKYRIKQRLGFEVNTDQLKRIANLIQKCRYIYAERQTNKRTKVLMMYPDTEIKIIAIYDRKTKNVVTVWKYEEEINETARKGILSEK